jgi:hypothetical protein
MEKFFTPLESPTIYVGDGRNRENQLIIEGGVKTSPFLTGFTLCYLVPNRNCAALIRPMGPVIIVLPPGAA